MVEKDKEQNAASETEEPSTKSEGSGESSEDVPSDGGESINLADRLAALEDRVTGEFTWLRNQFSRTSTPQEHASTSAETPTESHEPVEIDVEAQPTKPARKGSRTLLKLW
jgi:hypothetical protein